MSEDITWHVARTRAGSEGLARQHLERQAYRVLSPWYMAEVIENRRLVLRRRPWFSGYVFVGTAQDQPVAPINSTIGITELVSFGGGDPIVIPPSIVGELIGIVEFDQLVKIRKRAEPGRVLEVGQTHWITAGAFVDRLAEIASTEKDGRVSVLIGALRASIPASAIGGRIDKPDEEE